jgi:hypothetical protein
VGFIESAAEGVFRQVVDRVRMRADLQEPSPRPAMDDHQRRQLLEDASAGRDADAYRGPLERRGWRLWSPADLMSRFGVYDEEGRGQWRKERTGAFYPRDLEMLFPGGPGDLERWFGEQEEARRRARDLRRARGR